MTWPKFKGFFKKKFGDSIALVDSIWSKTQQNSKYQDKIRQDWAVYLKYL